MGRGLAPVMRSGVSPIPSDPRLGYLVGAMTQAIEHTETETSAYAAPVTKATSMRIEIITPERASRDLERNTHNRPLNPRHVNKLSEEMSGGNWRLNGEPIIYAQDGRVLDGQHRLAACVKSGIPFQTTVVYGVSEDVFPTIDVGLRRTGSHTLALLGEKHPARLAAALRYVERYKDGEPGSKKRPSNAELQALLSEHPDIRVSLDYCMEHFTKLVPVSLLAALHYLFALKDRIAANTFVYRLVTGLGIDENSPIYLLRERLVQNAASKGRVSEDYLAALTIKSFNAYRANESLKYLRFREKGASPEAFPVVK